MSDVLRAHSLRRLDVGHGVADQDGAPDDRRRYRAEAERRDHGRPTSTAATTSAASRAERWAAALVAPADDRGLNP